MPNWPWNIGQGQIWMTALDVRVCYVSLAFGPTVTEKLIETPKLNKVSKQ